MIVHNPGSHTSRILQLQIDRTSDEIHGNGKITTEHPRKYERFLHYYIRSTYKNVY